MVIEELIDEVAMGAHQFDPVGPEPLSLQRCTRKGIDDASHIGFAHRLADPFACHGKT